MDGKFDAVVIGRNEGHRLPLALRAATAQARRVMYVDSGSTDDSVAQAFALGVEVLELDPRHPFTAARGRNAGFEALGDNRAEFVQFIDADCVLQPGWPDQALSFLAAHPGAGLVFGRQFEAQPDASVYNFLTDWEWNKPLGPDIFCAGCVMMRSVALQEIGGYNQTLISGEDDDMCIRMQRAGWQTWRIAGHMTEHDARLLTFSPWWWRMVRGGYSYAALGVLHGAPARVQRLRAAFWGGALPLLALIGLVFWMPLVLIVLSLYAASIARQALKFRAMKLRFPRAFKVAAILMTGKFAELQGIGMFWFRHLRGQRGALIEYK